MSSISLNNRQIRAMKLSVDIGRIVQKDLGEEILVAFREGLTFDQIIERYDLGPYGATTPSVASKALHYAIYGYKGNLGNGSYSPLIEDSELQSIREERQRQHGVRVLRNKKGIHAMNDEERRNMAMNNYRKLSAHQRKKIIREASLGRGALPWSQEELEEIRRCARDPEYRTSRGKDNIKIAERLNELFHKGMPVRNRITVYRASYRNTTEKAV